MTRNAILDFYAGKSWAILEANLQEMYGIYKAAIERKSIDGELDVEAVAAKLGRPLDNSRTVTVRDGIAVLPIAGPIFRKANLFTQISGATSIEVLATDFRQALDDRAVRAIVLEINSPGGEVDGTSELAQHIFDARGQKPIVAYVSHLGASAAYWLASAADEIVANDTALLGSIGVIGGVCIHKDKSHLEFVSSQSPNKRPDPATEAGRAQFQSHVDALADVFISAVARNRSLTADEVIAAGNQGGLKVGQHAVGSGLADRVGTLESVIGELAEGKRRSIARVAASDPLRINSAGDKPMAEDTTKPDEKADMDKTISERVAAFFKDRFGATEASEQAASIPDSDRLAIQTAQTEAEAAKKEAVAANARIAELEKQARMTRFKETAKGWWGESGKHVSMLEFLATAAKDGEESAEFKDYVTQQSAIAEQMRTADLFKEVGTALPAEGSAQAVVAAKVSELMAADPHLTEAMAFDKVWVTLKPDVRTAFREEDRRNVN